MTKDLFREKIREKIADDSLQAALDANAERRVRARVNALATLPNAQERRKKAHAVREKVIDHLEEFLAQFITNVSANGIQVHRARDAQEALDIVLEITERTKLFSSTSTLLIAKAKSMLSEEIGLNVALEENGHKVVETDLGEYIVQLRGERPAHIISPAVHLQRGQVGQLFHEKLGIPYTEDIPTLVSTARTVLREVFLTADIGITGVNFGVAETGTLVLVTNEGNGRMCASLPDVHIALMGMERLLPTLDDLALCLSLLPRSATGQKLSVYTQLIHSPENGQQKHLIIVDNGRSRLRNSPLREALYCIRCGACLNACPVFREIGGHAYLGSDGGVAPYPGPIGSVLSPGLFGENFSQLAQASTLCGACRDACPVDIDLPRLLLRVRAGQAPDALPGAGSSPAAVQKGPSGLFRLGLNIYSRVSTHPRLFMLMQKLAGWIFRPSADFLPLPGFTGWGQSKDLPKPAARPFRERFAATESAEKKFNLDPLSSRPAVGEFEEVSTVVSPESSLQGDLVAEFTRELSAIGGHSYSVSPGELQGTLIWFLNELNIQSVQMWDDIPGVAASSLEEQGIKIWRDPGQKSRVGLTTALAGIAQTGTLVLSSGTGRPLLASLVPEIHIAVLQAKDILPALEQALHLPEVSGAQSTVLISGPSRTADIEMTLTIGVHGPGQLHVFVVDASEGK